jgi:hypothetical protein
VGLGRAGSAGAGSMQVMLLGQAQPWGDPDLARSRATPDRLSLECMLVPCERKQ